MKISLCIPCMNRTHDLAVVMNSLVAAANYSPPVQIMVLNYNSRDNLSEYLKEAIENYSFVGGNELVTKKFIGGEYYHMAHAKNLSVLASSGSFVLSSNADVFLPEDYFDRIRKAVVLNKSLWTYHSGKWVGMIGYTRSLFEWAGGYDERFEFYGKEDRDMILRLKRRPEKGELLSSSGMSQIWTEDEPKFRTNYRLKMPKREIKAFSKFIYDENIANEIKVANKGKEWGRWEF